MNRIRVWFEQQSPLGQWAAGCLGIVTLVAGCMYCLGFGSFLLRPLLITTPSAPTIVITIPTVARATPATPTGIPTFAVPESTLVATPTQAPIPTRAPTETPTFVPLPSVTGTVTVTITTIATATPNR